MNDTCFIANLFTTLLLISVLSTNSISDNTKIKKQRKPRRKRIVITI
jgi:hypothetical protein